MPQPRITSDTKYYVKFPGQWMYVNDKTGGKMTFSEFFDDAHAYSKEDAIKLAKEYSLDVEERIVTTSIETKSTIIYTHRKMEAM